MIKLTEKYAIDFDKRNYILQEKYEKRDGKGRNAPLSGEFAYRDLTYHGKFEALVDSLTEWEIKAQEPNSFEELVATVQRLKDEMTALLKDKVVVQNDFVGDDD